MKETKEQYNAITHEKGPCLVIAPPGSGKTFIIIERILYLIEHYNCNPERILVITYTKMAALEMKNRFCNSLTYSDRSPQICTFHSLFFKILQKTYQYTFHNIITSQEKITYLKICLNESSDTSYSNYFNEENLLTLLSVLANNKVNQIMNNRISTVLLEHNEFLTLE